MNPEIQHHLDLFATSFVEKARVERWNLILTKHKPKNYKHSAKLYDHLDRTCCVRNDDLNYVAKDDVLGVYYDFLEEAELITFAEAKKRGMGRDAIFSIFAGKLAVYFFHECENYVLKVK